MAARPQPHGLGKCVIVMASLAIYLTQVCRNRPRVSVRSGIKLDAKQASRHASCVQSPQNSPRRSRYRGLIGGAQPVDKPGPINMDDSAVMRYVFETKMYIRDFDCYFSSYAYLYHQKEMLQDESRMAAYHGAIMSNPALFRNKTVLDVGAGTGVLSIWASKAGAQKVYAVEYTDMAKFAKRICAYNTPPGAIEVMQGSAEKIELPSRVDVIVSEWMGMFLLRESMLDSLIRVRDRLLKPDGLLFPSTATMLWSLVTAETEHSNVSSMFGVNLEVLDKEFEDEQISYYMNQSRWVQLTPEDIVGYPMEIKSLDLNTVTLKDVRGVEKARFRFEVESEVNATGFAGWFTTHFPTGTTHWGQQYFPLREPMHLFAGDIVEGVMDMQRSNQTHRTYMVSATWKVHRAGENASGPPEYSKRWNME
ncbi:hypothetical protein AAMO2058_000503400 [Amorphochlora amoebiformis]